MRQERRSGSSAKVKSVDQTRGVSEETDIGLRRREGDLHRTDDRRGAWRTEGCTDSREMEEGAYIR